MMIKRLAILSFYVVLLLPQRLLAHQYNNDNNNSHHRPQQQQQKQQDDDDDDAIALPFGDVNLLVLTDVHSWIAGHGRHENEMNADYGDVLSLYERLRSKLSQNNNNLFMVMNGDFMDGTGLSTTPPKHLTPLLEKMPFDVINMGNHELYHDETVAWISDQFIPHWKNGTYLTSNTLMKDTRQPIGNRYTYLQVDDDDKILVFGFLYNFENNCPTTIVEQVQQVITQEWFSDCLLKLDYQAVLVMAHMHVTDPLITVIRQAIRTILPEEYNNMPIQFIAGHTHIRAYSTLDDYSASMEAGRFLDTIGFVSFPLRKNLMAGTPTETRTMFPHVFLDTNLQELSELVHVESLPTTSGWNLADTIHQTQVEMGLFHHLGCSPQRYDLLAGMDRPDSLWWLYMQEVIPKTLLRNENHHLKKHKDEAAAPTVVFVQGTGAFRYDLFPGAVVVDDVIAVCPFNDTIYQLSTHLTGAQLLEVLELPLNTTEPNEVLLQSGKFHELPYLATSISTVDPNQRYDLWTSDFHLADFVSRVERVLQKPISDPQPVIRPGRGNSRFWTTTDLWVDFVQNEWSCNGGTPKSDDEVVPVLSRSAIATTGGAVETLPAAREEKPFVTALFIVLIVFGIWVHQERQRKLRREGYEPIGDPATISQRVTSISDFTKLRAV